jgi:hypothetical protein
MVPPAASHRFSTVERAAPGLALFALPDRLYADAVRLRIALIVLALVVAPVVVFAAAESSSSPKRIASPGAAYLTVTKVPSGDVSANVANYLRHHPADSCHIKGNGAICSTANPDQVVVIVATGAPLP